jgi:hypothetical protein
MTIGNLKENVIEEGREHPFVRALVNEVRSMQLVAQAAVVGMAASGGNEWQLRCNAGRAVAFADVLRLIEKAKGVEE